MRPRVLIVGLGDLGQRYASALAAAGGVDLVLAGGGKGKGPAIAALIEASYGAMARYHALDGTRQGDVEALLRRECPDLVLQCGSLASPWTLLAGDDPHIKTIRSAGTAIQLSSQLPILHAVMAGARAVGLKAPIANLSWPDGTNPIMAKLGLAPDLGLGNATMICGRIRAALRRDAFAQGTDPAAVPLVRVLGDSSTLWPVLSAAKPPEGRGCRVYLGEEGTRGDDWAYREHPLESGIHLNELTCASSMDVVRALLPGGPPARASCPGVHGQPGGYPIRVADGRIDFDLPPSVTLEEAIAFNTDLRAANGIERIEDDGTVIYTEEARRIMAGIDPVLTEPLAPARAKDRFPRLLHTLTAR
jgi:hypothetical protein